MESYVSLFFFFSWFALEFVCIIHTTANMYIYYLHSRTRIALELHRTNTHTYWLAAMFGLGFAVGVVHLLKCKLG